MNHLAILQLADHELGRLKEATEDHLRISELNNIITIVRLNIIYLEGGGILEEKEVDELAERIDLMAKDPLERGRHNIT